MFASPFIKPREALTPPVAKMNMLAHVSTQKEKICRLSKILCTQAKKKFQILELSENTVT